VREEPVSSALRRARVRGPPGAPQGHLRIALVVGVVLTFINQADVILAGDATAATWLKCGLNFLVPFVVANLGLLAGARRAIDSEARSSG
jgi:hypothetical protein